MIKERISDYKLITIRKRNNLYEYRFEAGKVNGKRKQIKMESFNSKEEKSRQKEK